MALEKDKKSGLYTETDGALCAKFSEAGFGIPKEGKLLLHPLEAAYLANTGKSKFAVPPKSGRGFKFALSVYTIVRGSGRLVLPISGTPYLRAYAPGVGRVENRPSVLLHPMPGRFPAAKSLQEQVKLAHLERLDLVIACGTAEEPKFYKISSFNF